MPKYLHHHPKMDRLLPFTDLFMILFRSFSSFQAAPVALSRTCANSPDSAAIIIAWGFGSYHFHRLQMHIWVVVEPTHLKHITSSNWMIFPSRGENQKCFKPPPRYLLKYNCTHHRVCFFAMGLIGFTREVFQIGLWKLEFGSIKRVL